MIKLKKFALTLLLVPALLLTGCYNDDDLWNSVEDLQQRVGDIESRLAKMNSDIAGLQSLVESVSSGSVITACEESTSGWKFTMSDGKTVFINHGRNGVDGINGINGKDGVDGKDGKDGNDGKDGANGKDGINGKDGKDAPSIGIKEDTDGVYYWTITVDGTTDWLKDSAGDKMRVCGVDGTNGIDGTNGTDGKNGLNGKDGVTPRLGVLNGYWTVDYGDGRGMTYILDTKGEKIPVAQATGPGGLFESVNPLTDEITFTMLDGTVFSVPRVDNFGLTIDTSYPYYFENETRTYTMKLNRVSDIYITTVTPGWSASIINNVLKVTAPATRTEENTNCDIRLVVVNSKHDMRAFKISVRMAVYDEFTLTFEDADYKGSPNFLGKSDWSSLVDSQQYGGPLLYPQQDVLYCWHDGNNTELASEFSNSWGDYQFWGGGIVISNYSDLNLSNGDFNHQLSVYYRHSNGNGGHNGSKNFCVQNGYWDTDPSGPAQNPNISNFYFKDNKPGIIKEIWVCNTTYAANVCLNGNGLSPKLGANDTFKIVVYAYDPHGREIDNHPEFTLAKGPDVVSEWKRFDLSSLGPISRIKFNLESVVDNGHGMSLPAYFAIDDIKVVKVLN